MRRSILSSALTLAFLVGILVQPAAAKQFTLMGKPINVFASASFSLKGNNYFVEEGLQVDDGLLPDQDDYMAFKAKYNWG